MEAVMLTAEYSTRYSEVLDELKRRHRHRFFPITFVEKAVRDSHSEGLTTAGWIEAADSLIGKRALEFFESPSVADFDNLEPKS